MFETKNNIKDFVIKDMVFADDAAVAAHIISQLQSLMDRFDNDCTATTHLPIPSFKWHIFKQYFLNVKL